jgi:NADPH-dependent curcumin reductase CurA
MRGLLNPTGLGGNYPFFKLGETIVSGGVGRVVASLHEQFKPGDYVEGAFPWQELFITDAFVDRLPWLGRGDRTGIRKLSYGLEHISDAIGLFGMPGLTAYFAIQTGDIKPGDLVVVSSAGGAVGSVAGQLAKLKGATVVGLTSSAKKAEFLTQELKFDRVLNYKSVTFSEELTAIAPEGVDVYLESVGGRVGEIVMNQLKERTARIVLIGMVSTYNDDKQSGYINV